MLKVKKMSYFLAYIDFFQYFCSRKSRQRLRNRVQKYNFFLKNTNYSVKKNLTYLFLLTAVLFSGHMNAEVNHYAGAFGALGEWSLLPNGNKDYTYSLGGNIGLGGVYELQVGPKYGSTRFLFDVGVGAQAGLTSFLQSSSMTKTLSNQTTIDKQTIDYVYEVNDRHDQYRDVAVGIPVLFGVQHKKFYLLAGIKMNYHVLTQTASSAIVNTYGQREGLDPYRNQPEYQFFEGVKVNGGVKTKFTYDINATLEIGGRIGLVTGDTGYDVPNRRIEYRLAGFVDYGLFDIRDNSSKNINTDALATPDTYDPTYMVTTMIDNLQMSDIMSVNGFASRVNNMTIGLKFTVLFQLPKAGECVLCRDSYQRTLIQHSGGGTGVKHEE